MNPLDADVAFMTTRIADLLAAELAKQPGIKFTTDRDKNRIIVNRPGAADNGVIIIEVRGSRG